MKRRDPVQSAERKALAEAIQRAVDVKRAHDALLNTEEAAQRAVKAAEDAAEDAAERLAVAKRSAADGAAASMLSGDVLEMPPDLRTARHALVEAEDRLDLARSTRDRLNARRTEIDARMSVAQAEVAAARDVVLRTEGALRAKELTKELVEAQRRVATIADEIRWLVEAGAVPLIKEPGFSFGKVADGELRDALFRFDPRNEPLPGKALLDLVIEPAPRRLWAEASAALETDATTALPAP